MSAAQYESGWAVCSDNAGLILCTVRRTRQEAIEAFLGWYGHSVSMATWRRYKRGGWRVSHVSVQEHLLQKEASHAE